MENVKNSFNCNRFRTIGAYRFCYQGGMYYLMLVNYDPKIPNSAGWQPKTKDHK